MKFSNSAIGLAVVAMLGQTPAFADDYRVSPDQDHRADRGRGPSDNRGAARGADPVSPYRSEHRGRESHRRRRVVGTEIAANAHRLTVNAAAQHRGRRSP